jgi:acetyl-CoA acyltransferase
MAMRRVVIVDGVRIPFQLSQTVYKNELAVDLAQKALKGLLVKTALDPAKVLNVETANVVSLLDVGQCMCIVLRGW